MKSIHQQYLEQQEEFRKLEQQRKKERGVVNPDHDPNIYTPPSKLNINMDIEGSDNDMDIE